MTALTCDQIRAASLDPGCLPADWLRRPETTAHVSRCPACQTWLRAFAEGERAWAAEPADAFAAAVIDRTAGVGAILAELPLLAELDPGPGFTERVLRATSERPAREGWRARAADAWRALVRRPRFAWEAAYVATVCWVLVFGNPVGAIEWSASSFGAAARERLSGPAKELRADLETWRARLAPAAAPETAASASRRAEPMPAPLRAWQAVTSWVERLTGPIADTIRLAWDRVSEWFGWLADQFGPAPTEPPAESARSPQ